MLDRRSLMTNGGAAALTRRSRRAIRRRSASTPHGHGSCRRVRVRATGGEPSHQLDDHAHDEASDQGGHDRQPVDDGLEGLPRDDELAGDEGADPERDGIDEPFMSGSHIADRLTDAVRHLVTAGVLTSIVVAMVFRLVPVLEGAALPWPPARRLARWALASSVVLRSAQVVVPIGASTVGAAVALSGMLAWTAIAGAALGIVARVGRGSD